ncbi:MAG: GntR family transcriptional regulator [Alphaproteobacteria bacterium]|nr:GntR family transcriptional regulator [Alphaproteobacteria bacterium]
MTVGKRIFAATRLAKADDAPLYMRVKRLVNEAVDDGTLQAGDAIPSERDVADMLNVSRVTVRKAFTELVNEGLLTQRRGSGTYVGGVPQRLEQPLSRLTSFSEDMKLRGLETHAQWLSRATEFATPEEALKLSLSPSDRVSRFKRLRFANGTPMAIEEAVIPERFLPDVHAVQASLYAALDARGFKPVRALQRLHAIGLEGEEAAMLEVAPGAAALFIERVSYLPDGRAVEFTTSHYRGDLYDFVAELTLAAETLP